MTVDNSRRLSDRRVVAYKLAEIRRKTRRLNELRYGSGLHSRTVLRAKARVSTRLSCAVVIASSDVVEVGDEVEGECRKAQAAYVLRTSFDHMLGAWSFWTGPRLSTRELERRQRRNNNNHNNNNDNKATPRVKKHHGNTIQNRFRRGLMVWSKGGCGFAGLGSVRLPASGYAVRSTLPAYHSSGTSRSKSEPERGTALLLWAWLHLGLNMNARNTRHQPGGKTQAWNGAFQDGRRDSYCFLLHALPRRVHLGHGLETTQHSRQKRMPSVSESSG